MTRHDVLNGQLRAGRGQVVIGQAGQLLDLVRVVGQLLAGEVLGVVRVGLGGVDEHVGEYHVIEAVGAHFVVALNGIVDHQEGEEGIGVVSAGLSGHGAGLQLDVQVGQEVGGDHGDLAGQALGLDARDGAQQGVAAAARNDQSVDVGVGVDDGLGSLAAGIGGGAAVLGLEHLHLVVGITPA